MKRKFVLAAGAVVVLCLVFAAGRFTSRSGLESKATSRRVLYYVDPMHPSYHSDKPGIAPDCGMALEPVYEGEPNLAALPATGSRGTHRRTAAIDWDSGRGGASKHRVAHHPHHRPHCA